MSVSTEVMSEEISQSVSSHCSDSPDDDSSESSAISLHRPHDFNNDSDQEIVLSSDNESLNLSSDSDDKTLMGVNT